MPYFTVYDPETGIIFNTGFSRDIDAQAEEGRAVVEGKSNPRTQRVVEGKILMIPKKERDARERERAMRKLRGRRNRLLRENDWRFSSANWETMTLEQQTAWREYRQMLLDITKTANPLDPVWPDEPHTN